MLKTLSRSSTGFTQTECSTSSNILPPEMLEQLEGRIGQAKGGEGKGTCSFTGWKGSVQDIQDVVGTDSRAFAASGTPIMVSCSTFMPQSVIADSSSAAKWVLAQVAHGQEVPQISRLASSTHSWAGKEIEKPSKKAIEDATKVYCEMESFLFLPNRIISSGEGGVAFCFVRGSRYADMEFLNSGDLLASLSDRQTGESKIWEFTLDTWAQTARRIQDFIGQHGESGDSFF